MKPIDEHVRERVNSIFMEKERYAYQLKEKAAARTHECMYEFKYDRWCIDVQRTGCRQTE